MYDKLIKVMDPVTSISPTSTEYSIASALADVCETLLLTTTEYWLADEDATLLLTTTEYWLADEGATLLSTTTQG